MGGLEVVMDRREVLEERDVEVMPTDVPIRREEPVVDRVQVERVTCGPIAGLKLLPIIDKKHPFRMGPPDANIAHLCIRF